VKLPLRRGTVPRHPDTSSARRRGTSGGTLTTVWGMEQDNTQQTEIQAADTDVIEELLVEEISIDGMCGVY